MLIRLQNLYANLSSKTILRSAFTVGLVSIAIVYTNCDQVRLELAPVVESSVSTGVQESLICTSPATAPMVKARVLFVIDFSGSNFSGNDGRGNGTDPTKNYRYGAIEQFVTSHSNNPDIGYGLIGFNGSAAFPIIKDRNGNVGFTTDLSGASAALAALRQTLDQGATPYHSALQMASAAIQNDRAFVADPSTMPYNVVFISDGSPTDYGLPVADSSVLDDVSSVLGAATNVKLSTVYYGPEENQLDANAVSLLTQMATQGKGVFLDTNVKGRETALETVVPLLQMIPNVIKRFMVINLNAAPCDDGSVDADSDADGLCDKDEQAYNDTFPTDSIMGPRMNGNYFNPTGRNSFGNNYSDYFNYLAVRYGQFTNPGCTGVAISSGDLLTDCEKQYIVSKNPTGPTDAWTSTMGRNADPRNFDSDGDGFLDSIEMIYSRNQASVLDFNSSVSLVKGFRLDQVLLQHLNPISPSTSVAYDPDFHFDHAEDGKNCYSYQQTVLPLYQTLRMPLENTVAFPQLAHNRGENIIFIYYIETPVNDPNAVGTLHSLYRTVSFGKSADLAFTSDDFQTFVPTETAVKPGSATP